MPVYESEAIVLQSYPLGEADRLVSFFSRTMGRMRGVAAGARKPKSRFGSTLERLSHIRIWFYERENRELVRISQCDMIESFLDAFGDYDSSVALSLFSEITEAVLPDREPSDANFRLLLLAAQTVKRTGNSELPLAYFSLWTVKLGGWLPSLDACSACGSGTRASRSGLRRPGSLGGFLRQVPQERDARAFNPGRSGIAEDACWKGLIVWPMRSSTDQIAPNISREVTNAMLDIIEHQIDRKLVSRQLMEPQSLKSAARKSKVNSSTLKRAVRPVGKPKGLNFQDLLLKLEVYWTQRDCILQQPYDIEVGAGTMHPETFLRVLGPDPYRVVYAQPSRRPADGRYGENPNRLYKHTQLQVILKPSPANIQDLYLDSLKAVGINLKEHDVRFEEDNWESPTLGAWGMGWQILLDGLEITQFTYFQQCGGIDLDPISVELTYGLDRIAAYLQGVDNVFDVRWSNSMSYRQVRLAEEQQFSAYSFDYADAVSTRKQFDLNEAEAARLLAGYEALEGRSQGTVSDFAGLRFVPEVFPPLQSARCARRNFGDRARGDDRPRPETRHAGGARMARPASIAAIVAEVRDGERMKSTRRLSL